VSVRVPIITWLHYMSDGILEERRVSKSRFFQNGVISLQLFQICQTIDYVTTVLTPGTNLYKTTVLFFSEAYVYMLIL